MKKAAQVFVIALMPVLFILGYLSFDGDISGTVKNETTVVSAAGLAGFVKTIDNGMVLVDGGRFRMGSNLLTDKEKPEHEVTVSSFWISKTKVTVEQFGFFVNATGYKTNAERDSGSFVFAGNSWHIRREVNWRCDQSGHQQPIAHNTKPVLHVSWYDAQQYCAWLSKISGKSYRLPTEAEWEFAAKGGNKSAGYTFSGSNDADVVSWNGTNSGLTVHDVGLKKPNELGLYDMSGDAWEWCRDWYAPDYYSQSPQENPEGPVTGTEKVCHGGSFLSAAGIAGDSGSLDQLKPACRGKELPYIPACDGSFRIAMQK